jgi:diphosphomevalonate decarboxylase
MQRTAADSPYYGAWLETAPVLYGELRTALLAGDLAKVGFLTERSALAMHASALAAGVVYVTGATLDVLAAVRALRRDGRVAYATMDAGPHVKVLTSGREAGLLVKTLRGVPGVLRVLETAPGDGAQLIEEAL